MTRRNFFALSGAAAVPALCAPRPVAIPATAYRDYSLCLADFLRGLAADAYRRRNAEIAKLTTADRIRARQAWVRETFWKITGGMPERTPLNARTAGSFTRAGYRVEKVVYESRPQFHVTANLYIPEGAGPFPGILFQMGHSANGKAYEPYQRCCQGLVKLGFLVLAFDPMGQGERIYYPGSDPTRSRMSSPDNEHTVPGRQMLLYGDTSTRMQVWDAVRSLDYLASHPRVDPARLGSTGQSGGGTVTMLLSCVDDRLAAAAVMCGNTENVACSGFNPPGSTDDAEQNFLGSGPLGFDRWDLLYPIAPKPLLISVSAHDFFGTYSPNYISNGREEFGKLRRLYETLGHPDRLAWYDTPLPHSLAYDSRLKVYGWFTRWLKNQTNPISDEPTTTPETPETLRVTESGSTVHSLGSLTPFVMNSRRQAPRSPMPLDRLLGVDRPAPGLRFTTLGRVPSREVSIHSVEVPSAPSVWLPAWLFTPTHASGSGVVYILLGSDGRGRWHEGELYQTLAARGNVVCVPELRGIGDLTPEYGRGAAGHARSHNSEHEYAWSSLILGKPMLGQWVTDILAVTAALRAQPETRDRRIVLAARSTPAVAALMAAALDPGIDTVYLAESLVSFADVAATEDYHTSFANFVPHLLDHTDLPEVAASIRPRRVVLAGALNARGTAAATTEVARLYPGARVLEQPDWSVEALLNQ